MCQDLPSLRRVRGELFDRLGDGVFNLESLDWDAGVLETLGLSEEKPSRPVLTTHVVEGLKSGYAERLGPARDTPFVVGANDGVLANFGVGPRSPAMSPAPLGPVG